MMLDKEKPYDLLSVFQLLNGNKELSIPDFQRPYRWKANKHVKQLLEDINREIAKQNEDYRVGTIILYKVQVKDTNTYKYEIVDGQQRLTTISLILFALDHGYTNSLFKKNYTHKDSKNNIKYNFQYIQSYVKELKEGKEQFLDFIKNNMKFVVIVLDNLSEAFQLFDSQNARGKTLAPSNLLKAFHLRSMNDISSLEKLQLVQQWEKNDEDGILNPILSENIYRLRSWASKEYNYFFTRNDIEIFKGINIEDAIKNNQFFPYIKRAYHNSQQTQFLINETIVNGSRFFYYVQHYIDMHNEIYALIEKQKTNEFSGFFNYNGFLRIGDQRLFNLYFNIMMAYVDRFGKDEQFVLFGKELFRWVFSERIRKRRISADTILKMLENKNPLKILLSWKYPDLHSLKLQIPKIKEVEKMVNGADELLQTIQKVEA